MDVIHEVFSFSEDGKRFKYEQIKYFEERKNEDGSYDLILHGCIKSEDRRKEWRQRLVVLEKSQK